MVSAAQSREDADVRGDRDGAAWQDVPAWFLSTYPPCKPVSASQWEKVKLLQSQLQLLGAWSAAQSNDHHDLLRFLRARCWDVAKAQAMWMATLRWRADHKVDAILHSFHFHERDAFLGAYPHGIHKTDKLGRPVLVQQLGGVDLSKLRSLVSEERWRQWHVQEMERLLRVVFPACSAAAGRQVDQVFSLIDLKGVGMGSLPSLKALLTMFMSQDSANYPETLGKMAIVNAPKMVRFAWGSIQSLLNADTVKKIVFLTEKELLEHIDADNLLVEYGGKSTGKLVDDVGPWPASFHPLHLNNAHHTHHHHQHHHHHHSAHPPQQGRASEERPAPVLHDSAYTSRAASPPSCSPGSPGHLAAAAELPQDDVPPAAAASTAAAAAVVASIVRGYSDGAVTAAAAATLGGPTSPPRLSRLPSASSSGAMHSPPPAHRSGFYNLAFASRLLPAFLQVPATHKDEDDCFVDACSSFHTCNSVDLCSPSAQSFSESSSQHAPLHDQLPPRHSHGWLPSSKPPATAFSLPVSSTSEQHPNARRSAPFASTSLPFGAAGRPRGRSAASEDGTPLRSSGGGAADGGGGWGDGAVCWGDETGSAPPVCREVSGLTCAPLHHATPPPPLHSNYVNGRHLDMDMYALASGAGGTVGGTSIWEDEAPPLHRQQQQQQGGGGAAAVPASVGWGDSGRDNGRDGWWDFRREAGDGDGRSSRGSSSSLSDYAGYSAGPAAAAASAPPPLHAASASSAHSLYSTLPAAAAATAASASASFDPFSSRVPSLFKDLGLGGGRSSGGGDGGKPQATAVAAPPPSSRRLSDQFCAPLGVVSPPSHFLCPLTRYLMKDPVAAADGYLYEKAAIQEWFLNTLTSPCTGLRVDDMRLTPVTPVRHAIRDWAAQHGIALL